MMFQVDCRVNIPVVGCAATGASPRSDRQRQFLYLMTTGGTGFARWKEAVDDHQPLPLAFQFVRQEPPELAPASINNAACQAMVFNHVVHRQVFQNDSLVFACQSGGLLVVEIGASIGCALVCLGNLKAGLISVAATLGFARQLLLLAAQVLGRILENARIFYLFAVRECGKMVKAKVRRFHLLKMSQGRRWLGC